jgi:hypothetical protein
MHEYICCKCSRKFTTEIPWNRDVKEICLSCALDELELEEQEDKWIADRDEEESERQFRKDFNA